ncbi:MAG: hypothetical protein QM733_11600 [Ilumatobacteraceae bacterium]
MRAQRLLLATTVLAGLAVIAALAVARPAHAAPRADQDALTQLAERFAPIVMLQHQAEPCGSGEPYAPLPVEQILDQPDVVLQDADGEVLVTAPSADDLAAAPEGSNIDLPGDAGDPGCDFEERFGRRTATLPVTQYARLAVDDQRPGRFAVQYWWWYVYNDWNDLHEGDWEMGQLVFEAATPEDALAQGLTPSAMALSQHYGTEVRPWSRVRRDGDRPIVFAAAGSHAGYYSAHRWFGTDGDSGFGCDDTRGPSDRVDPEVVVLPASHAAGDPFGWMDFQGRWGQRQVGINDSETGPQTTDQWQRPIRWMEESGRPAAAQAPEVGIVTTFFCGTAANGSSLLNAVLDEPWLAGGIVIAAIVALVLLARQTTWRPAIPKPLATERAAGQILTSAWRRLRDDARRFLPIAAFVMAGSILTAVLQSTIIGLSPFSAMIDVAGRDTPVGQALAVAAGFVITVPVGIVAIAWTVDVVELRQPSARRVWRRGLLMPCIVVFATVLVGWVVLPVAVFLLARWFVAPAVAARSGGGAREALRTAAQMTRGRRLRTFAVAAVAIVFVGFCGAFLGTLVLLLTGASFAFVNVLAGLVGAVLLPWLGLVSTMAEGDLRARHASPPSPAT